ncbi:hypothetical protein ACFYMX_33985 [Streptomyces griseofuscus]|uniref:hypothetical protein n=1 Tax=Streptomyces TaxID=1883 RepID=UPI0018F08605|nr:hypothetical protein [Streptomyces sp. CRPSP2-6A1]MBJ6998550.1 hypothetical protein [Streptomyces sp. CRPSP2-6A1]
MTFTAEGLEAISLRFGVLGRIPAELIAPETIVRLMTNWLACQSRTRRWVDRAPPPGRSASVGAKPVQPCRDPLT